MVYVSYIPETEALTAVNIDVVSSNVAVREVDSPCSRCLLLANRAPSRDCRRAVQHVAEQQDEDQRVNRDHL